MHYQKKVLKGGKSAGVKHGGVDTISNAVVKERITCQSGNKGTNHTISGKE